MHAPAPSDTPTTSHAETTAPGPTVSAAILAGGRARRMHGQDKSALDVGGQPILARQLAVLHQVTADVIIVTAQAGDRDRFGADRLAHAGGARIVPDLVADAGPLGGLYTALTHTSSAYTLVVACDMPFVSLALLRHLVTRVQGWDAAVPRTADTVHPLCAAYAHDIVPVVRRRLDEGRLAMVDLLDELRVAEVGPDELARFDPDDVMLSNVNTPHDYRQACSRALVR